MEIIEKTLEESFKRVKKDILSLQAHLLEVSGKQGEILQMIENLNKKVESKSSSPKKTQNYVASKKGKSFHVPSCPFAKNIQSKSKINFKSIEDALNEGFKACECVKKN
jgi:hypothetical protein